MDVIRENVSRIFAENKAETACLSRDISERIQQLSDCIKAYQKSHSYHAASLTLCLSLISKRGRPDPCDQFMEDSLQQEIHENSQALDLVIRLRDYEIKPKQEFLKDEQAKQRAGRAKARALAEINQMQAAFRFQHPYECKRCPERFSSNSQLHRHISAQHTKKSIETPPTSYQAPPPPLPPPSSPNIPKSTPSPPPSPVLAPTVPEKALPAAQTIEDAPRTPPQTPTPSPRREIFSSAPKPPAKTVKVHETSPHIFPSPHKRAYMTIAQLLSKFGSSWTNACSELYQPIRKLDPTAPIWTPVNASKSSQSGAFKSNWTSASAKSVSNSAFFTSSKVFTSLSASLPPNPPRQ